MADLDKLSEQAKNEIALLTVLKGQQYVIAFG